METDKNPQVKMTEAHKRYEELDRLALDFVRVDTDVMKLSSLDFEDHAYVMSMAHLYALCRLGYLSPKSGKEVKLRRLRECQKIHSALNFARHLQARWVLCTKVYCEKHRELSELIKKRDPLALEKALELLDILSGQYIYTKLYEKTRSEDMQVEIFEELIDEACDEEGYEDRASIKELIKLIIEEFEEGKVGAAFETLTEEEERKILLSLPPKETLSEEIIKELMPRTK